MLVLWRLWFLLLCSRNHVSAGSLVQGRCRYRFRSVWARRNKCFLRINRVSSHCYISKSLAFLLSLGMEWGVFPRGHCVTFFIPQEVRTQPWAGGEARSRHWNGPRYWREAEGSWFPGSPAHVVSGSITALLPGNSLCWSVRLRERQQLWKQ